MRNSWIQVLLVSAAAATGCMRHSDIEISNPLKANAVAPNKIVKSHRYTEQERGLPPHSMDDEAVLLRADAQQICFSLTLHELSPIDLRNVQVKLSAPKADTLEQAQLSGEQPLVQTYDGLIPERHQTGTETVCTSKNSDGICTHWDTHPTYTIVHVPGPVKVYTTRGQLCFDNRVLSADTPQVTLAVRVPRQTTADAPAAPMGMFSFGLGGGRDKGAVFRWGFVDSPK
jgi:hypothetical protein